jgi:hypothetical protein
MCVGALLYYFKHTIHIASHFQVYGWPSFTRGDGFANAQCAFKACLTGFKLIPYDNSIDECA